MSPALSWPSGPRSLGSSPAIRSTESAGAVSPSTPRRNRSETTRLALAIRQATGEVAAHKKQLTPLVQSFAPGLLGRLGVGPVSAAQAIVSFSHVGRCRNDAAFAALAGASRLQASSGRTVRTSQVFTGRHVRSPDAAVDPGQSDADLASTAGVARRQSA